MTITESQVQKIIATIRAGLRSGQGSQLPGDMCVEAAVCYGLNLPHGDDPGCVDPAFRALTIMLNDSPYWISPESRALGMEDLALVQLGSLGTIDTILFVEKLAKMTVRVMLPRALRQMASMAGNERMINHAEKCERIGDHESLSAHHHLATSIAATFGETRVASVAAAVAAATAVATAVATVAIRDIPASIVALAVAFKIAEVVIIAANLSRLAADNIAIDKLKHKKECADHVAKIDAIHAAAAGAHADIIALAHARAIQAAAEAAESFEIAQSNTDNAGDTELHFFAGEVLKIAKEMNFPGCKWLQLLERK